jgi:hypothetical protein
VATSPVLTSALSSVEQALSAALFHYTGRADVFWAEVGPACMHTPQPSYPAQWPHTGQVAQGSRPSGQAAFPNFQEIYFQLPKFISFEFQIQILLPCVCLTSVRMKASLTDPLDHVNTICMPDVVRALVWMITI